MMSKERFLSLDQFRGFAVFSMIFVNVLGHFAVIPELLKHHRTGFTFADAVAPWFVFAVGIGFRLWFVKKESIIGKSATVKNALRRYFLLTLIGFLFYFPYFASDSINGRLYHFAYFDAWNALVWIGLSGLLASSVIGKPFVNRVFAALFFLSLFNFVCVFTSYGPWMMRNSASGGPLGMFAWVFILLAGSLVADCFSQPKSQHMLGFCMVVGIALIAIGFFLSNFVVFSKPNMTLSYVVISTGISFLVFAFFFYFVDKKHYCIPHLSVLGKQAFVVYVAHEIVSQLLFLSSFFGKNASLEIAVFALIITYIVSYACARLCDYYHIRIPL